jgi:hypothetical protein
LFKWDAINTPGIHRKPPVCYHLFIHAILQILTHLSGIANPMRNNLIILLDEESDDYGTAG